MFQTQLKLVALFLVAPLITTTPIRAGEPEQHSVTDHHDQRIDVKDFTDFLKRIGSLRSADGDVYQFEKDGTFAYRRGEKSAKGMTYTNDYGIFTVDQKVDTDNRPGGPKNDLVLKITSAKEQSSGKTVPLTDTHYLDIEAMTNPKPSQGSSQNVSVIYVCIGGKRFDQN